MRLRTGFVSNSSSTSFLIIQKEELSEGEFFDIVGIETDSPFADAFSELYDEFFVKNSYTIYPDDSNDKLSDITKQNKYDFPESMKALVERARQDGWIIRFGWLSSDETMVQTFFCTDCFSIESDVLIVDAIGNTW